MSPRALSFLPTLLAAGLLAGCGPTQSPTKQINGTPESTATSGGAGTTGEATSTSSASSSASSSTTASSGHSSAAASSSSASSTGGQSTGATGSSGSSGDVATPDLGPSTPICTVLEATTDVNLRQGPATTYSVILVVPTGAQVTTINSEQSQNGFYNVSYQGVQGYTYANYYRVVSVGTGAGCGTTTTTSSTSSSSSSGSTGGHSSSSSSGGTSTGGSTGTTGTLTARDLGIQRAQAGMGFSYFWGHGRFLPAGPTSSTIGSCTGNCPSCTHSGGYGGDCSGLAGKVWTLGNPDLTVDDHPYSTYDFVHSTHGWHATTRTALIRGDALTYNTNGAGHIFIYESGDGWGDMWAYECKGCAAGCVHDLRSAGSSYIAIARDGW